MTDAGGVLYCYDNNGNQTRRAGATCTTGGDSYIWDSANRLTGATVGGTSPTYAYRADGLRHSKTVGGTTTTYTWDVQAKLPVVIQDLAGLFPTLANSYVYGHSLISQTDSAGVQTYFLGNALGSTEVLTDASGNVTGTRKYDVFGAVRSGTGGSTEDP